MNETGLYWKALPEKNLTSKKELMAPDHKMNEDMGVIMLTCANSIGIQTFIAFDLVIKEPPGLSRMLNNCAVLSMNE